MAAATFQVGIGLLAVLLCGLVAPYVVDSSVDTERGLLVAVALLLGVPLFAVWVVARTRRRWLWVLGVAAAVLALLMIGVTAIQLWPAREEPHTGVWSGGWWSALDVVLWLLVLAAVIVELGSAAQAGDGAATGVQRAAAIAAPLAIVVALPLVVGSTGASAMVRFNSDTTDHHAPAQGRSSALTGRVLWQRDLTAGTGEVATKSGLAVPVSGDRAGSAGVLMLDPASGATLWRYHLRGVEAPPNLASTAGGTAIVVSFDGADLEEGIPNQAFTVDAATGQVLAFWPDAGEVQGTDPPVLFNHVARGTNSVIALSPAGKKLWTYRPERCADPRSVRSTPSVMIVRARQCDQDHDDLQILGLDAQTGEQRWAQPAGRGQGDSGPTQVVVEDGRQFELSGDTVMSRQLDTGAISWTASAPRSCSRTPSLVSAGTAVIVGQCDDSTVNGPTSLTAYAATSGAPLWRRTVAQPIASFVAVDDRGVLALTHGEKTCDVQRLQATTTQTLLSLPASDENGSAGVRCSASTVLRIGDMYVVKLLVVPNWTSGGVPDVPRYRFVGLA